MSYVREGRLEQDHQREAGLVYAGYRGTPDPPPRQESKWEPKPSEEGKGRKGDGLGVTDLSKTMPCAEIGESARHDDATPGRKDRELKPAAVDLPSNSTGWTDGWSKWQWRGTGKESQEPEKSH